VVLKSNPGIYFNADMDSRMTRSRKGLRRCSNQTIIYSFTDNLMSCSVNTNNTSWKARQHDFLVSQLFSICTITMGNVV
jgi:hypothetical protein